MFRCCLFGQSNVNGSVNRNNNSRRQVPSQHQVNIVFAVQADAVELAEIAKTTYRETYTDYDPVDREKLLAVRFGEQFVNEFYLQELASRKVFYFLVKDKDKNVGYAKVVLDEQIAELSKIYLLKSYQGLGIGSKLLQHCFHYILQSGINAVKLVVDDFNGKAKAFYKKNGFKPTDITFTPNIPNSGPTQFVNEVMLCNDIAKHFQADKISQQLFTKSGLN